MSILVFANAYLDLAPRRDAVDEPLAELWQGPSPCGTRHPWLRRYGADVLIHGGGGLIFVGEPGETWPRVPVRVYSVCPSAAGLAITDPDGVVYTWVPGEDPREVWRTNEPGSFVAWSLGRERILVSRFVDKTAQSLRAIALADAGVRWEAPASKSVVAVIPHGLLLQNVGADLPDTLECRDLETGEIRWTVEGWPFGEPLALVDDVLWRPSRFSLIRIDVRTGTLLEPVAIPQTAVPDGVVDERGIFHSSHGSNYQVYDLRDNGRELSSLRFKLTFVGPKSGAGPGNMVVTPDGRMIFGDHGGNVWVVHPDRPTQPERVWQGKSHIFGLLAHRGRLVVLLADGRLAILGKP